MLAVRYSAVEILRHQDMSALTAGGMGRGPAADLRARRSRPSCGRPAAPGPSGAGRGAIRTCARTLRRNMRTGGVPIRRAWRSPVERPRRLVLLLDVSGSMEPYARGLARFAHAAVVSPAVRAGSRCSPWAPA